MDFDLNDDQRLLKESIDRLLAERYDFERRNKYLAEPDGWSREMWGRYAEMGLLAMPFATEDGGLGGGAVETLLVTEAFGRALVLEPYLATVVLGGGLLRFGASPSQRSEFIPPICEGRLLLAFAHVEDQSRYDLADVVTSARQDGRHWILNGQKRFVLHGDCADKLFVSARIEGESRDSQGLALFLVDARSPGLSRRNYLMHDRLHAADVTLDNVRVKPDCLIGEPGAALPLIEKVVDMAIAALCSEAVGAMSRAHEITLDYLKLRKQFGASIGSFQVLQHRAVDMLVMIEQARGMAMYAAMMSEAGPAERRRAISAAKVQIGQSGKFVGAQAIQLHGGIGMTDECQAGHYYRRLTMIEVLFGDTSHHLGVLAAKNE
jgi:pimeloyl-CoA dehydrogenase small subunit